MEVRRSTVDLRSISFSCDDAGKLLRYMERSIRSELCNWSSSLTNFSFCQNAKKEKNELVSQPGNRHHNKERRSGVRKLEQDARPTGRAGIVSMMP